MSQWIEILHTQKKNGKDNYTKMVQVNILLAQTKVMNMVST